MRVPAARQPVMEMVNGELAFTRPWYLFLTGQPVDISTVEFEALQQLPIATDQSAMFAALMDALAQTPTAEEMRAQIAEMQKQIDALSQVPV